MRSTAACMLLFVASICAQQAPAFVPVGVVVEPAGGPSTPLDRDELVAFARLRFNVIARRDPAGDVRLELLARVLGQRGGDSAVPSEGVARIVVDRGSSGDEVRSRAWMAIASGARGVVFDGAAELARNPDALRAASAFADNVTRNASLFAPLKARAVPGAVRVDGDATEIDARFLESSDALVLIAINRGARTHRVTLVFTPDVPEAIWQNMENGGAVNFVAGSEGPIYARTFGPHDVVVLMIRKQYK